MSGMHLLFQVTKSLKNECERELWDTIQFHYNIEANGRLYANSIKT